MIVLDGNAIQLRTYFALEKWTFVISLEYQISENVTHCSQIYQDTKV